MRAPFAALTASMATLTLLAALMFLAACDGDRSVRISSTGSGDEKGVLKVVEALQCPDSMGELTRKGSAQADGAVCIYTGPRGTEVSLHLAALGEQAPEQVLKRFEDQLTAVMPAAMARVAADAARTEADAARADADAARRDAEGARAEADAARAEAEASAGERVTVAGPGMRVDPQSERASVRIPGLHIEADGGKADVRIGGFTISADGDATQVEGSPGGDSISVIANQDAAQIRSRAAGDATRQSYVLTDENPSPAGWRMVGYEARGPRGGPLVVATIRSKDRDSEAAMDDAKDLVTLNVGE